MSLSLIVTYILWLTVVSFIADADRSTRAVPMATAEPWASLANVNIIHSPAVPLSCSLLLNPAELRSSETSPSLQMLHNYAMKTQTVILWKASSRFLPWGDVVRQLDRDSGPGGAVNRTVVGGFVELEGGAANVVHRWRKTFWLDQLPRIGPGGDAVKGTTQDS